MVLTVALEEEVSEFLERRRYERNHGNHRGYCNGQDTGSGKWLVVLVSLR